MAKGKGTKLIAQNKKAYHDYFIEETIQAGISLAGTEVKSLRMGKCSLKESYIQIKDGEAFIYNMHISPYEQGNIFNKDPLRPRRLLLHKAQIRKWDHELLEMLLYGCIPRGDTNPVAHLLLKEFGSLSNLLESDAHEIAKTEGVGLKSAIFLTQLHEVIRRYEREKLGSKPELTSITRCVEYCRQLLSHYSTERFYIICTDSRRRVIHVAKLAEGTVGSVFVSNRQAVEVALRYKSAGVIFCHNHPGGRVTPSNADLTLTVSLKKILDSLGVRVLDHIIIGENGSHFSFFANGLLKNEEEDEEEF